MEHLKYLVQNNTVEEVESEKRQAAYTLVYMAICLTCTVWQMINASTLVYRSHKILHMAVLFQICLAFLVILCSVLNPLIDFSCEARYWVSIVSINLAGCCIQNILLYKAYICYDRAKWLIWVGSFINLGYLALIALYSTLGRVDSTLDLIGNCILFNLEWPAIAKLGLDILSNAFLSVAFLLVIHKHYRMFGNNLHKSLLSSGIIFSVGVIASNLLVGILIAFRVVGGLSADLYSFDWVITGYLLIKQFKHDHKKGEDNDHTISKTMQQDDIGSILSDRDDVRFHIPKGGHTNSRDNKVGTLSGLDMLTVSSPTPTSVEDHKKGYSQYFHNCQKSMIIYNGEEDIEKQIIHH
ncbi:hypothetical protein BDA99DRAFT_254393 [Phascolomyces articulosus]|uniref:Transmembrane protein n=1 Tax=Phascolomyces articulosus TaxID=60185 RepID=A0AAD5P8Q4_9FUNG|nr:hypothetical protein BDA99DRAFT_254393 [Phascolomyces articulosus]